MLERLTMNASRTRRLGVREQQLLDQVRCAARKNLGVDLREVQVAAGTQLFGRCIVEMQTGEGKTLSTVFPAAGLAASSRNVLVATANDYLSSRDTDWMGPIYRELGLSVGCVTSASTMDDRSQAYRCDVTYGTLREFAFDSLRHSLAQRQAGSPESPPLFAFDALIVDEADSILIDEARTPMLISAPTGTIDAATEACYRWCAEQAPQFRMHDDYVRVAESGAVALTDRGRRRFVQTPMATNMAPLTTTEMIHSLERAIWVNETVHCDHHYVVNDGRVNLVDEFTGRGSASRNLGGGIHQAIEAREGLALTAPSEAVARISVQDFVSKFKHLSGITATAREDRWELKSVYGLSVVRIPTHQPCKRTVLDPVVCGSVAEKWERVAEETEVMVRQKRAVLIGTRWVAQSEELSRHFESLGIEHVVLNARNHRREAEIVAKAGMSGRVTIATNMAGRGTDIRLDPQVAAAGGLHVIVSELHGAARIDRQLIGRCGRQGDTGTARVYVSPCDEILAQAYGHQRAEQMRRSAEGTSDRWLLAKLMAAQKRVARNHRKQRSRLTAHEANLARALGQLGLDPHLDPVRDGA